MKKRIDVLVFENGLAPSREKAKTLIIAGQVKAAGHIVKSPSEQYETDIAVSYTHLDVYKRQIRRKCLPSCKGILNLCRICRMRISC